MRLDILFLGADIGDDTWMTTFGMPPKVEDAAFGGDGVCWGVRIVDDVLDEGGDGIYGCLSDEAGNSVFFCPRLSFVFLVVDFAFCLDESAFALLFFGVFFDLEDDGALFFLPIFNLIIGVNGVESSFAKGEILTLSVADRVATLDASGFAFFVVDRLVVNPDFNRFGVEDRVYSALWRILRSVTLSLI